MATVIKSNGKYILQPDPVHTARATSAQDKETLEKEFSDAELRSLLARILIRLDYLEQG